MRYFKMMVYVDGGDYETRETLIDEPTFRQYQKAMLDGAERLVLEDRVIKTTSIKEIFPADDIVHEYLAMGVSLKSIGLPDREDAELGDGSIGGKNLGRLMEMKKDLFKI
jgi:hypothetical protein